MRISQHQHPGEFRTHVGGPPARVTEKEALLRSEAVDIRGARLTFHGFLKGGIRDHQTAQVGDRFTYYQLSVFVQTRLDLKAVELIDDALRFLLEGFEVGIAPPVDQVAGGIELGSLIVKAVSHLMTNHRSHAAVIQRIVCTSIKERRLQNAGRKNYFIDLRVGVSVYRRRRHAPLSAVHRFTDLVPVTPFIELSHAKAVSLVRTAIDRKCRV